MRWHVSFFVLCACGGELRDGAVDATTDVVNEAAPDASSDATPDLAVTCARLDASNCATGDKVISCAVDGGVSSICLGDAGANCGYGGACTYFCDAGEYAAWCGGPNTPASPPSSACHDVGGLPNGSSQYCCPCE